uniref:Sulfatase-modifying factor enzyme 1 n=1 Tax=Candidatus Kentrum sp. TUN TaxID=2126343 RepID=A0A450ZKL2_9GAMM|nr:MAG: Sulfatase-modifying factor enzyme 1 [Candidatus Kentron sp. TUN]
MRRSETAVTLEGWEASRTNPNGAVEIRTDREVLTLRRRLRPAWASTAGRDGFGLWAEFEHGGVVQRLRWCPPGKFMMGSPTDEPGRYEDEGPQHEVVLREGFWLFHTPVTQQLWQAVMGENPSRFQDPHRPVENVSWRNSRRFLAVINERIPGLDLMLPSEAQ